VEEEKEEKDEEQQQLDTIRGVVVSSQALREKEGGEGEGGGGGHALGKGEGGGGAVDAEPLIVRLLWLGEKTGLAASVCDAVVVRVRPHLQHLSCVVVRAFTEPLNRALREP
jgi:hypothetical protein